MKTMLFPTWIGETVYKICPKCNDKHDGSCKNCAWEGCIWSGCNSAYSLTVPAIQESFKSSK